MALIALLAALSFSAAPASLVLGKDAGAELEVRAPPGTRVAITASVGLVGEVRAEGGIYRAHFTPPALPVPTVALLLAVAEEGEARELGWLALPLSGSDTLPLETRPGAAVLAEIGGKTFGPVTADRKGSARLPVVVPPGISIAMLRITDRLGNHSDKPLDLDPPPFSRLRLAARAEAATSGSPLEVEVFVVKPDGTPDNAARVELSTDRGELQPAQPIGPGLYLCRYLAPAGEPSGSVAIEAKAGGRPSAGVGDGSAARGGQLSRIELPLRRAQVIIAQPFWQSTLATQKPWSHSLGLLGGGGVSFDGAGAGTVLAQFALRLEVLPLEALAEVGGSFFSPVWQAGGERAHARDLQFNLGARLGYKLARRVDGFVSLTFGVVQQHVRTSLASGKVLELDDGGPRAAFAAGVNVLVGPGRFLAQLQADSAPSGMARLVGSVSALQLFAGYLFDLP